MVQTKSESYVKSFIGHVALTGDQCMSIKYLTPGKRILSSREMCDAPGPVLSDATPRVKSPVFKRTSKANRIQKNAERHPVDLFILKTLS